MRKVTLPSLDTQVRARLVAFDARLNPVHAPELAGSLTAHLATPLAPWHAFAPILSDKRNNDIWEQMAEDYYRLMQESGDALVTVQDAAPLGSAWTSTQVRRLCQLRLASLPRSSLELHRQSVNAEARALLEQGLRKRDPAALRRLADELFCSRVGDRALDSLGDLAFERGHFEEAQHWWRLLEQRYPGPEVDIVRVEAKQVLASMFEGRLNEANDRIARFRARHPNAKGDLAGERGVYHAILAKTLTAFQRERIANNDESWPTFGGEASRNRVLSQGLSWQLWEDGPAWRVPLASYAERGSLVRGVAYHPIIVNEQVLIADHRSVVSYHLKTGKEAFRYDLKAAGLRDPGAGIDAEVRLPRFTLSADHERVYARLGGLRIGPRKNGEASDASYLVCLDLTEPGKNKPRELWHVKANGDTFFEGAPLVHHGRVFIARTKVADGRALTSILCYDIQGRQRWVREVCDAPEFDGNQGPRHRQHLLTLAGGQVVYASHSGAIVAVDAWTGQPTWAVRYPSRGPRTAEHEPSPRDLTPCVYADGWVYAAPLDSDRLFCIDAFSGAVRWDAEGVEIVQLLGVAHGRVLATTQNGLRAYEVVTGRAEWMQPSEERLAGLGRGLIAGSWLFWPTHSRQLPCRAVNVRDGTQELTVASVLPEPPRFDPTMFKQETAGNWALGNGHLAIASANELVVYAPPLQPNASPDPRPHARAMPSPVRISGFRIRDAE